MQESAFVDGSALSKSADADAALHALGDDSVSFGYFTATVTVVGPGPRARPPEDAGGQAGDPVPRVRRSGRDAQQPRRLARLSARARLRERPPPDRAHRSTSPT